MDVCKSRRWTRPVRKKKKKKKFEGVQPAGGGADIHYDRPGVAETGRGVAKLWLDLLLGTAASVFTGVGL